MNPIIVNDSKSLVLIKTSLRYLVCLRIEALSSRIMCFDGETYYNDHIVPLLDLYKNLFDEELF